MRPYLAGGAAVLLLMVLMRVVSKSDTWNPLRLARGEDGKTSTSKLQFVLWTGVIAFSYVVIFTARLDVPDLQPLDGMPQNVLIAMGLSVVTAAGAKGITVSYLNSGRLVQTESEKPGGAVVDDKGDPDLVKIQMLLWTVIALVAYLFDTVDQVQSDKLDALPDIDAALMVLMGLGQGAYLGNKLVTTTTPFLTDVDPKQAAPNAVVTLTGTNVGSVATGTVVTMDGKVVASTDPDGDDPAQSKISLTVPQVHPTKGAWPAEGLLVEVGIVANGAKSANVQALFVKPAPPT